MTEYPKKQDIRAVTSLDSFEVTLSNFHSKQDGKIYTKVTVSYFGLNLSLIGFNGEPDIVLELKARRAMRKNLVAVISATLKRAKEYSNESSASQAPS